MLVGFLVLAVSLFALLAAFVTLLITFVGFLLPILLIVAGGWLLAKALHSSDRRHHRRRDARQHRRSQRPSGGGVVAPPTFVEQHRPARRTAAAPSRELPVDVEVKAEQIRHKVDVLLAYSDRFEPFSQDLYLVRQIAADYLPRTIGAYLSVPGLDNPRIDASGRTALDELREQLRILDARLDEITLNLQRQDLDGLLANRRFLEERFGVLDKAAPFRPVPRGAAPPERTARVRWA
jgi:hypothetical protein